MASALPLQPSKAASVCGQRRPGSVLNVHLGASVAAPWHQQQCRSTSLLAACHSSTDYVAQAPCLQAVATHGSSADLRAVAPPSLTNSVIRRRRRTVAARATADPGSSSNSENSSSNNGSSNDRGSPGPRAPSVSPSPQGPFNNISLFPSATSSSSAAVPGPEPALAGAMGGGGGSSVGLLSTPSLDVGGDVSGPNGGSSFSSGAAGGMGTAGSEEKQAGWEERRREAGGAVGVQEAFTPGLEAQSRQGIFNRISSHYDELNDVLSLGQHWVWKSMAVKFSQAKRGQRVLDVCCGSGDLAFLLQQAVGARGQVVGLDFAAAMLEDAAQRQRVKEMDVPAYRRPQMKWVQGDAMALPFEDEEFEAATMGYGLRNVADIPKALRELYRVLRPGASVAILDFNNNSDPLVDQIQALALEYVVVPVARQYGLEQEYEYLRPSIKRFPTGPEQEVLAREAGFVKAVHYPVGFGLMGILVATKGPPAPGTQKLKWKAWK